MRSATALFFLLVASAIACGDLVDDPPPGGTAGQNDSGAPQGDDDAAPPVGDDASIGADTASGGDDSTAPSPDATGDDASTAVPDATIPTGATIGSCDPRLWNVSASDSHPVSPASFAVDGIAPTRWSTGLAQAAGQYYQVDFGGFVVLDQVAMDDSYGPADHADYPRGFSVLGSTDGATYGTTLTTQNVSTDPGGVLTTPFPAQAMRSIRIQLTTSSTSWWSMHELRLGCSTPPGSASPDGGPPTNYDAGDVNGSTGLPHTGWAVTASSVGNSDVAANAIDGNTTTRWSSGKAQYGDEWIRVDLGQSTNISQVWLTSNATDFSSAYALDVSADDVTYTNVISGVGDVITKIPFARRSARYVRVRQIGSDDTSWWSVYEITVIP